MLNLESEYDTIIFICGIGLVVECLPSKQKTRVRFSYPAHKTQILDANAFRILCFTAVRESKDVGAKPVAPATVAESG